MTDKKEKKVQTTPNVKLAAGAEPLGAGPINVGMETLPALPDEEAQRAGFYFAEANLLLQLFPDRFKRLTVIGKKGK